MSENDFELIKVPRAQIGNADFIRLWAWHGCMSALASIGATERRVDTLLTAAVRHRPRRGFGLPVPFVRYALGRRLWMTIPARLLTVNFYPWVGAFGYRYRASHYFVGDGDWKNVLFPFSKSTYYREMGELLTHESDFTRAPSYQRYLKRAGAGNPVMRNAVLLKDRAMLDAYYHRYLALLDSIRQNGLARLGMSGGFGDFDNGSPVRRWFSNRTELDIGVGIGADGSLIRIPDAQHRSAIAVHLDLPAIPVEVRMVHRTWLTRILREAGPDVPPSVALTRAIEALQTRIGSNPEEATAP